ncbi:MAG: hypothetical protein ACJ77K_03255 [Bacteroidia bacterium]
MQTYTLNTLLQFFEAQQLEGYEAIEIIIGILEIEDMPDEDKKDAILYTLRKHGMNELTHKGGRFEPTEKTNTIPVKPYKPLLEIKHDWCYMVQVVSIDLLSGTILVEIPLN